MMGPVQFALPLRPRRRGTNALPEGADWRSLLHFQPREMVRWLAPAQLVRTGVRALFAGLIAAFVDGRELQAALPRVKRRPAQPRRPSGVNGAAPHAGHGTGNGKAPAGPVPWDLDLSDRSEVWIDYLADTGDGFAPTYAVAMLLGKPELEVRGWNEKLPAAELVVMGGDEVYPTPSRDDYRNRLVAPLTAARPQPPSEDGPYLVAIPGNHDWYDGLTSFLRLFCEGAPLGSWQTVQSRSYFGIALPHGWQLWGADIQPDSRIDAPQLAFFDELAAGAAPGDRLILCVPVPAWLKEDALGETAASRNLRFLEQRLPQQLALPLELSGDVHFYSHYVNAAATRHCITTGAAGAYARGSRRLPRVLPGPGKREGELRETGFAFPDRAESSRISRRTLRLPFLGEAREFCTLVALLYLASAATLDVRRGIEALPLWSLRPARLLDADFLQGLPGQLAAGSWAVLRQSPLAAAVALLCVLLPVGFAALWNRSRYPLLAGLWGTAHGLAHVLLQHLVFWGVAGAAAAWLLPTGGLVLGGWLLPWWAIAYAIVVPLGWVLGGLLVGAYLVTSERLWGLHDNEVYSAQAIPDYRSFLRLHVTRDAVTIFPIGVRHVPRRWRVRRNWRPGDPLFEPVDDVEPVAHLIEGPIVIPAAGVASAPAPQEAQPREPAAAGGAGS